jgi:RNA polymerase sigma-70 factor (ECF subfamily)
VTAARFPLAGATRVAKFVTAVSRWFWTGVEVDWAQQNGQAAAVLSRDGIVLAVITVNASAPGIDQVMWMMNPAKFTAVSAAG